MNINYQKELDQLINKIESEKVIPSLLLHSCCAPCSSYCIEYLSKFFQITVFYYNPNISPDSEYLKRVEEQKNLIQQMNTLHPVKFIEGLYEPQRFYQMAEGMETMPEGGERCFLCYRMRLLESALTAKERGFDFFTTTLSISPRKNAQKLNEIGKELEVKYGVAYLYSDFKKKNGYQRSIELSKEYGLYRQNYCGCIYSKQEGTR